MIDELTLYNLEVKYHNLKDIANAIEEMVRAEVIEECIAKINREHTHSAYNNDVYEAIMLLDELKGQK